MPPRTKEHLKAREALRIAGALTCAACPDDQVLSDHKLLRVELHHLVPVKLGGTDEPANLLPLCHLHHVLVHGLIRDAVPHAMEARYLVLMLPPIDDLREAAMARIREWEEIRRSTPQQVAEHRRWARYAVDGASLEELRQLVGMSRAEVGRVLGASAAEVGRFERLQDMPASALRRYIEALGGEMQTYCRKGEKLVPLKLDP